MVNHIVMWNFKTELSEEEKADAAGRISRELNEVRQQVEGVVSLEVVTAPLSSSNKDIGLVSVFENEEALQNYQVHPAHVAAGSFIRTVTENRTCLDYEV